VLDTLEPWATFVPAMLACTHPGVGGGDSGAEFMSRVGDAFARIIAAHSEASDDAHVLVVGHGLSLGAYLSTVDPSGLVALPNASVSAVEVSDRVARLVAAGVDVAGHGSVAARPAPALAGATTT
jgi:probable phosphoglycerate mutase